MYSQSKKSNPSPTRNSCPTPSCPLPPRPPPRRPPPTLIPPTKYKQVVPPPPISIRNLNTTPVISTPIRTKAMMKEMSGVSNSDEDFITPKQPTRLEMNEKQYMKCLFENGITQRMQNGKR